MVRSELDPPTTGDEGEHTLAMAAGTFEPLDNTPETSRESHNPISTVEGVFQRSR